MEGVVRHVQYQPATCLTPERPLAPPVRPMPPRMLESAVLPRIHPMRLRIAKPFNDPDYIFELKHSPSLARGPKLGICSLARGILYG